MEPSLPFARAPRPALPPLVSNGHSEVLLVDDSATHVLLMREANRSCGSPFQLSVAGDGVDAMEQLRAGSVRPRLILLDLSMPRMDGREVLRELKANPDLRHIPVVVFSSSDEPKDVRESYELGAACFVSKPSGLPALVSVVRVLAYFWLEMASLPE